jgi:CheY-like chemotaxis protein
METTAALIISYDYVLRDILTKMLISKGYKVVNCSVGGHGIRALKKAKGNFDIVLMDSKLPDMSGLHAAKKIKEISRTIPIILLRGGEGRNDEDQLRDAGVDLAIRLPIFVDKTYELIKDVVASGHTYPSSEKPRRETSDGS